MPKRGLLLGRPTSSARALDDEPLGLECGIELRQSVVGEGAAGYRCPGIGEARHTVGIVGRDGSLMPVSGQQAPQ